MRRSWDEVPSPRTVVAMAEATTAAVAESEMSVVMEELELSR